MVLVTYTVKNIDRKDLDTGAYEIQINNPRLFDIRSIMNF